MVEVGDFGCLTRQSHAMRMTFSNISGPQHRPKHVAKSKTLPAVNLTCLPSFTLTLLRREVLLRHGGAKTFDPS